jgi:hypothetical protein
MKMIAPATALLIGSSAFAADVAQYYSPDENQSNCVANPAQLAQSRAVWDAVGTFGGLANVVGTWELKGIPFKSQVISFSYSNDAFYVQAGDDSPNKVSVCSFRNADNELMLRIAIHAPACPERKNIYVQSRALNEMYVSSFSTRYIGSVHFERTSPSPKPYGNHIGPKHCAGEDKEEE